MHKFVRFTQYKIMEKAEIILSKFATPQIIIKRTFKTRHLDAILMFHPEITDSEVIRDTIAVLERSDDEKLDLIKAKDCVTFVSESEILKDENEITDRILSGDTALFLAGSQDALILNTRKWDKRAVAEPPTEVVVNGPREGFTEDIKTNLSLIVRRLRSPHLAIERLTVGRISKTGVAVLYLNNIADKGLSDKLIQRIKKIDVDAIIDVQNLEPYIDDRPYSMFRQAASTEKPDVIAAKLLEGRVAVMIDGSPMVLTLPFMLLEDFQSSEDYYQRHSFSTFLRILRFCAIAMALYLPGLYVIVQLFNYDILPIRLLVTVMNSVKGIPLPPLIEMLFVILLFEIIREASVRMPKAVGTAMGIVGALVLGDTAVKAGILSPPAILITALSSIALFLVPKQISVFSILRIIYTIIAGLFGLYGLVMGLVFIIHYLTSLDSYNTPQLAPFAPMVPSDQKDALKKEPITHMKKRPESIPNNNKTRQG